MRRDKRIVVIDLPVEDPEKIVYVVPEREEGIPVEFPQRVQREYTTVTPEKVAYRVP